MIKIIEREHIIYTALLYNYIANGEISLPSSKVDAFLDEIKNNLQGTNYELSSDEEQNDYLFYCGIRYDDKKKSYSFKSEKELRLKSWLYDTLPKEVVKLSLSSSSLETIGVNKDNLQVEEKYDWQQGYFDISSTKVGEALTSARNKLESKNCRNIILMTSFKTKLDSSDGYRISYVCEGPFERVDSTLLNKKLTKRLDKTNF